MSILTTVFLAVLPLYALLLVLFFPLFALLGLLPFGCLNFEIPLPNIVYLNSIRYNRSARKRGNPGFVILGHLTAKRVINSLKANSLSLLQHEGDIITDRGRIDTSLQEAWNPIFAKYPTGETKAEEYNAAFALAPGSHPPSSFARPTLEDLHYVLRKKLKSNTATGLDGWRPHELVSCLRSSMFMIFVSE